MTLVPIGQAAALLGVRPSALRYYEERGLVRPAGRRGGKRHYSRDDLRRLAFVQLLARVGAGLDLAGAVLDQPSASWRARTQQQIEAFERQIAEATIARGLLQHILACPAPHPVRECPTMLGLLDRHLGGVGWGQLAKEHGATSPPPAPRKRPPRRRARA